MRARLGRLGVLGLVALAVAVPAWGQSAPGTYNGTFAGGGTVSFDVSGNTVTRIAFSLTTACGTLNFNVPVNDAIANNAFSHSFGSVTLNGTFPAPQAAQGTMQVSGCSPAAASYSWSATAPATPPVTTTPIPAQLTVTLSGTTRQRLRRSVTVRATASEGATVVAAGTVTVQRSHATTYVLVTTSRHIAEGATATLRLRLASRPRRAIARALRNGRQVSAQVTVTGVGDDGSQTTQSRTIQLRRP
jgi:hypothetical protein